MSTVVFATKNEDKLKEIIQIMNPIKVISMTEAGFDEDIVEDGTTFEENAEIKATTISKYTEKIVLADDSGLEIDFLDKAPGVYSARYLGEKTSYDYKNAKILDMLKDVPWEKRTARFVCAICASYPDGKKLTVKETIEGHISFEPSGENGFGYDPIFYVEDFKMTTAEMSPEQKNQISHRAKALLKIKDLLM